MTAEELNRKYTEASWLIAKLSASAAGRALLFSSQSLEDASREIAAVYALSEEEMSRVAPGDGGGAVAGVQRVAGDLFGPEADPNANQATRMARTAIQNGQAVKTLSTLLKAGPKAAQAAAVGGSAASRGTPWGWIATAAYAAGSAGWFAYNARAFNLRIFEFVREREGIETTVAPPVLSEDKTPDDTCGAETITLKIELPTVAAVASRASELSGRAGAAVTGMFARLHQSGT